MDATMEAFRKVLNKVSQEGDGDRTKRVDKMDFQISRHNGASGIDQNYHIHKDSYKHDPNNEIDGTELRKYTMVVFLNDDLDQVREKSTAKMGSLRLYSVADPLSEVYDVIPRLGRAVLLKSEETLHKINPTLEFDNYAATIYFTQIVKKTPEPHPIPDDWQIFVNIISYRDPYLLSTLK